MDTGRDCWALVVAAVLVVFAAQLAAQRDTTADALQLGEVVLHSHPDADRPDAAVGPHPHAAAGIPTLHYGPDDARLAHGPDERVPVHEVLTSARTLAALALDHCGVA
jgi:acetylornithine deacetylase/succinyl-diaminopimelate desuccinylase-like protein